MLDHTWFWFWTRMVAVSICWLIQLDSTAQFPNIYCMSKTCYQLINLYCQGEMSLLLSGFLWPCWHWLITCMCSAYLYWSEGLSHFLQTALSWLISAGSICGHWLVFGKMISLTSALQLFSQVTLTSWGEDFIVHGGQSVYSLLVLDYLWLMLVENKLMDRRQE